MNALTTNILELAGKLPEEVPMSAKELLHLGNRAAVDQALSRLVKRGQLVRAGRGLYLLPVKGRFGIRYPEAARFVEALSEQRGESVAPQGAAAANLLGLTTQVPVREVYITSGRGRKLTLGGQVIEMRHAPAWQLMFPGRPAGTAIRALAWLGPERAAAAIPEIQRRLPAEEVAAVLGVRRGLPTWMAQAVSALAINA